MKNLNEIKGNIINTVSDVISGQAYNGWNCTLYILDEPKMPLELILEDAE